jgi:tetratricopeptide (TPR) repeat protein
LATALLNQGKMEETIAVLERSMEAGPAGMPHFLLLGQTLLQLRQYEKAKRSFETAIQMAPEYPNAYYGLATACARLGQEEEALRYREKFRESQSKDLRVQIDESKSYDDLNSARQTVAEAYVVAGRLYRAYGDDHAAKDHWARAAELDPLNPDSRIELARLYEQEGRPRDALNALLPLRETRSQNVSLWMHLGRLHAAFDELDEAEEALRRVVELAPQRSLGYAALAQVHLQANHKAAEAAEFARQAVRRESTAANYFLLSTACERCGDLEAAIRAIEKALQSEPGNAQYRQMYLSIREKM